MTISRRFWPARISGCLAIALWLGAPLSAHAEDDASPFGGPEQRGQWYLATTLNIGGGIDDTEIATSQRECERPGSVLCSGENFAYAFPQLDVRLYTPQQIDLWGDPRFFARGSIGWKFGNSVGVDFENPNGDDILRESAKIDQDGIVWEVGLGVAVPFEVAGRPILVETSVSYGREVVTATARYADDDAGRFKNKDELELDFIRPQLELSTPLPIAAGVRMDAVIGASTQITISNEESKQRRFRVADIAYEKDLGFAGFVGLRFVLGDPNEDVSSARPAAHAP